MGCQPICFFIEFMRLKFFFFLWCIFSLSSEVYLFSQNIQANWITGQRDSLPAWVYTVQGEGMVISSSDPCMTLEDGRKQAVRRALWLFTLQNQVNVQMLSDVFSSTESSSNNVERHSNKILSLIMMDHKVETYSYEILNEYQTLFGEVLIQVKFYTTDKDNQAANNSEITSFSSQSEWMVLYTDDKYAKKDYKIKIQMNSNEELSDGFELKGNLDYPVISSSFDGQRIITPQKGCWYKDSSADDCSAKPRNNLIHAFWPAYVVGLADQLFSYSFLKSNISSVLDNYQSNTMYDLSREKAKGVVRIIPQILGVNQNKLIVDWKVSSLTSSNDK